MIHVFNPSGPQQPRGYKTAPRSYKALEVITRRIRRDLRLIAPQINGLQLFERMSRITVKAKEKTWQLDYAVKDLPGGVEALAHYKASDDSIVLCLSETSYNALRLRRAPRAKHSVCHELMHAVLHTDLLVSLARVPHREAALQRGASTHRFFEDTEWQADSGAAAMLMPADLLENLRLENGGALNPGLVAEHFGVSAEAAGVRIKVFEPRREELLAAVREVPPSVR